MLSWRAMWRRRSEKCRPDTVSIAGAPSQPSFTARRPSAARAGSKSMPDDYPRPVVRPQDDSVPPCPRARPRRASRPDLAQEGRQQDLHLVERKRHPEADPVAAAEREPLVRPELPLQEPLGPEPAWLGVEFPAAVDQVRARAEDPPGGVSPAARRERPHRLAHDERRDRAQPQALADHPLEVLQRRE